MTTRRTELAIVGGGPAGTSAALRAAAAGVDVTIVDEQPRLGGQIFRQPPCAFRVAHWMTAAAYRNGVTLLRRAESTPAVRKMLSTAVWGVFPASTADGAAFSLMLFNGSGVERLVADRVLIAAGCYERPVPFPGWHLPGVMSAGAIQTLLKSQQVAAGRRVVLAGSHPLLLVVADQLLTAGVGVAAVVFAQSMGAPFAGLRSLGAVWSGRHTIGQAFSALQRLRRARVPMYFGSAVTAAMGGGQLETVQIDSLQSRTVGARTLECDALGVCFGFLPSSELARQAGAASEWSAHCGWTVRADEWLRTSVPGVYVAGEQLGVAGADAAAVSGELAGLAVTLDLEKTPRADAEREANRLRHRLARYRRFGAWIVRQTGPSEAVLARLRTTDTLVCRCEDVTVGDLTAAARANVTVGDASSVKLLVRTGMGPCQGRMCEATVRSVLAELRGLRPESIPGYTVRPPILPVPLGLLADFESALDIDPTTLATASRGAPCQETK